MSGLGRFCLGPRTGPRPTNRGKAGDAIQGAAQRGFQFVLATLLLQVCVVGFVGRDRAQHHAEECRGGGGQPYQAIKKIQKNDSL